MRLAVAIDAHVVPRQTRIRQRLTHCIDQVATVSCGKSLDGDRSKTALYITTYIGSVN